MPTGVNIAMWGYLAGLYFLVFTVQQSSSHFWTNSKISGVHTTLQTQVICKSVLFLCFLYKKIFTFKKFARDVCSNGNPSLWQRSHLLNLTLYQCYSYMGSYEVSSVQIPNLDTQNNRCHTMCLYNTIVSLQVTRPAFCFKQLIKSDKNISSHKWNFCFLFCWIQTKQDMMEQTLIMSLTFHHIFSKKCRLLK